MNKCKPIIIIFLIMTLSCTPQFFKPLASEEQCEIILKKIISLEYSEKGFTDEALVIKTTQHFLAEHPEFIQRCTEFRIGSEQFQCLEEKSDIEDIIHECFGR